MTEGPDNSADFQQLDPVQQTLQWLTNIVVGLNLCPFAGAVLKPDGLKPDGLKQGGLHLEVCEAELIDHLLAAVLQQLDKIQQCDESSIATSLLVFSRGLRDFNQYWDFVEIANEVLVEVGLEGIIQIATFHPDYCFEGMEVDDISNYTNRSPYPMLHFIREEQLEKALASYPDVDKIPDTNIQHLRSLGKTELLKLLAAK